MRMMMTAIWMVTMAVGAQTPAPLYKVQVTGAPIVALNYGNRQMASKIGFEGTVLLPYAKGEASVVSRKGATEVQVRLEGLLEPTRFGPQYLTYVMWALTPNGRAVNLGQLVAGHNNKARMKVSTPLQTFALIVTAEPYHAVTQPGDFVVLQNVVTPLTQGQTEVVRLDPQLMPRAEAKFDASAAAAAGPQRMVSMPEYEALLELYQAQNAIYRAQEAGADQAAGEIMARAGTLLEQAKRELQGKQFKQVVATSRQATQTAEDARAVANKKSKMAVETATGQQE